MVDRISTAVFIFIFRCYVTKYDCIVMLNALRHRSCFILPKYYSYDTCHHGKIQCLTLRVVENILTPSPLERGSATIVRGCRREPSDRSLWRHVDYLCRRHACKHGTFSPTSPQILSCTRPGVSPCTKMGIHLCSITLSLMCLSTASVFARRDS